MEVTIPVVRPKKYALSVNDLHANLYYNPFTGVFTWKKDRPNVGIKAHDEAGCVLEGYRRIGFRGHVYRAHQLAVFWMTGKWPAKMVDHINRDTTDNRWENLREASHQQNAANSKAKVTNISGLKGVYFSHYQNKRGRKKCWMGQIRINSKTKFLGWFVTKEEAHEAYTIAAKQAFGEFSRNA